MVSQYFTICYPREFPHYAGEIVDQNLLREKKITFGQKDLMILKIKAIALMSGHCIT